MAISPGTRLGPYEVIAPVGAGGMGEVFKARDTRLERSVAIKVLPAEFATDAQLRLRFEREAKAISQLTHPNICTLYDVGDGYLVMELLDGETLADRISRGPLPLDQVIRIGTEIANALDRAHRAGIVHRDLKPSNVMLTKSGAKLLDFGLAKESSLVTDATMQKALTGENVIVGTMHYMAPEQIEGGTVDARTDIFALGALLYEMTTGKRAFPGKSKASVIASILTLDPQPIAATQPASPAALDRLIRTCLAKDPDERWQSAHDIAIELRNVGDVTQAAPIAKKRTAVPAIAAALAVVALAAVLVRDATRPKLQPQLIRFEIPPPASIFLPVVSPDGKSIVAATRTAAGTTASLWLRPLDGTSGHEIAGTDGAAFPFWSPDSRWIAYHAAGKLKKVPADGGPAETICETGTTNFRGGTWSRDGVIVFSAAAGTVQRVPASGGKPVAVGRLATERHENNQRFPSFLPDGQHFLYVSRGTDAEQQGIYVASLSGGEAKRISRVLSNAIYAPPGFVIFADGDSLRAQRFDTKTLELTGSPFTIADHVFTAPVISYVPVGASDNGVLVYRAGSVPLRPLSILDRSGKRVVDLGEGSMPAFSPDGKRIACERLDKQLSTMDIWVVDEHGNTTRMTDDPRWDQNAVWSRDGRYLAWQRVQDVYRRPANGAGPEERIATVPAEAALTDWTPDGRYLVGHVFDAATKNDLFVLPLDGHSAARRIVSTEADELWPRISPDGRWIAFSSNESGRFEVYVQRFDPAGTPQPKLQVSHGGALLPHWSADGKSIVWRDLDGKFMTAEVRLGTQVEAGEPRPYFDAQYRGFFDVARDGRIAISEDFAGSADPVEVVVNWPELVK